MPNEIYNWYCVFHSLATITRHAANIRIGATYQRPVSNRQSPRRLDPHLELQRTSNTRNAQGAEQSYNQLKTQITTDNNASFVEINSGPTLAQISVAALLKDPKPSIEHIDTNSQNDTHIILESSQLTSQVDNTYPSNTNLVGTH